MPQVFSCETCQIFNKTFFTPPIAASETIFNQRQSIIYMKIFKTVSSNFTGTMKV